MSDFFKKLAAGWNQERKPQARAAQMVTESVEIRGSAKQRARDAEQHASNWAHLNDDGKKAARRDALVGSFRRVAKAKASLKELRAEVDASIPTLPALDPSDVTGAMRDQEIRNYWRSLPIERRDNIRNIDPTVAAALTRAPAMLSGMSESVHARLQTDLLIATHGDVFNAIQADIEALKWADESVRLAEQALKEAAEFKNRNEFSAWAQSALSEDAA